MNVILIDYESLQPAGLAGLQDEGVSVLVFVGAQQNRIPFEFADAMQRLGEKARYVKIGGTGRNALDFHLAFYLGELVHQDPDGVFRVVSKDSGFDPLASGVLAEAGTRMRRGQAAITWTFLVSSQLIQLAGNAHAPTQVLPLTCYRSARRLCRDLSDDRLAAAIAE